MNEPTVLWHDYETFGTNAQKDLPCQFAAVRTDMDLNIIGKPINWMCRIANDYLPQPQACLITGITPQQTLRDGMTEAEFAEKIYNVMSEPQTCVAGYNSIRFDDEVSRHLFHRNLLDPYSREWRNGNSRWDIIDLVRACYALRPEGVVWPEKEDGTPSFRLEDLTKANDLEHGHAHDALSDVYATIALAKLIRKKQPKLYEYAMSLRTKQQVLAQFDLSKPSVLLHISSKISALQGCATWVMPVCIHPHNPNAIVVIDLSKATDVLLNESVETIRQQLYSKSSDLVEPELRPGLKLIHINRSPFVTTAKAMTEDNALRLGIDREACLRRYQELVQRPDVLDKVREVYNTVHDGAEEDADHALYSGGFLNDDDRRWCERVHTVKPDDLAILAEETQHPRLQTQLFRYRARNYPFTLNEQEMRRWHAHRQSRLTDPSSAASITLEPYMMELEQLMVRHQDDANKQAILRALYQYAENL